MKLCTMFKTRVLLDLFVNLIGVYHLAGKQLYLLGFVVTIRSMSRKCDDILTPTIEMHRLSPWRC